MVRIMRQLILPMSSCADFVSAGSNYGKSNICTCLAADTAYCPRTSAFIVSRKFLDARGSYIGEV